MLPLTLSHYFHCFEKEEQLSSGVNYSGDLNLRATVFDTLGCLQTEVIYLPS